MTRTIIKAICNGEDYYIETGAGQESPVVEFLLVGGGGGGGGEWSNTSRAGGGGGGGGVIYCECYELKGTANIVIGAGGCGGCGTGDASQGCKGGDSCFGTLVAYGGGGGGGGSSAASNGGSGGGAGYPTTCYGCGVAGQGNNGGCSYSSNWAGGGGGPCGAGCNGVNGKGGNGGAGFASAISGDGRGYAGGGGGGGMTGDTSSGGAGGGHGGMCTGDNAGSATYYGGGGGGAGRVGSCVKGGNGCQGVFIMRYPATCGYQITGGCKYQCGIYCIHCFTCDGCVSVGSPLPAHNVSYVCGNFCAMRTGGTISSGCGLRFYFTAVNDMCLKTFGNNVSGCYQCGTITDRDSGETLYTFPYQMYTDPPTFQTDLQLKSGHRYAISMAGWSGGGYSFDTFEFDGGIEGPLSDIIKDYSGDIVLNNTIIMCLEDIPRFT